uniref:Cadherin domain-containing protein n=1 Tax=Salarias fasciatus TaxID=181472 RepID=A0A672FW68_SALFA
MRCDCGRTTPAALSGRDMAALRWKVLAFLVVVSLASCGAAPTDILYRVPEEQPPNTQIGSLAADQGLPDTGHLYKLEVGSPYLRVDGKTGEIYTTEIPIDRETLKDCRNLFEGDKCFLEFEVSITDMVLDINDNTPQFSSPILTLSIPENTHIGAHFSVPMATDRDSSANGVAEYSLSAGPDADQLFNLQVALDSDEKLPQLVVMGNLDREKKDSYDLNIRVVDGGRPPRASSALLRVTVTDQNDNAPKFERNHYEAELPENSPLGHSVLQLPHRRVTFSTANQAQDLQDASQHSYYDSGLEESETPSSKSSSGPRIGPLALPEDHYERTTPDGSIGEMEHPENGKSRWSFPSLYSSPHLRHAIHQNPKGAQTRKDPLRVGPSANVMCLIKFPQFPARRIPSLKRCVTSQQRNTINMQHNQVPRLNELTSQLCKS